ncbi:Hypothetical predicted protein [Octopus vulgaris]|uniref:Ferric-chelate reductase 1 n=1 Tax=Octopus vulgaris TaxID=6645 RepID=A0AA36FHX3_OCTVU|nr:Hypothetical predicted protein [Octopus vulgaris]
MSKIFVCVIVLLTILVPKAISWPDKVSEEACVNKIPHKWPSPQTSHPPYKILLSDNFYKPNDIINVTVKGQNGTEFQELYLVIVSEEKVSQNLGTFDVPFHTDGTLCGNQSKNSYFSYNKSNNSRNFITTTWKAPEKSFGKLLVIATVVQDKTKYWMNVNATLYAASSTDNDDCGKQKGCLDCEDGCLISWIPSKDKKTVHFEFSLPTKSENAYVAMGISPEPQMDGDHVIECVQGNSVHILRMSHNTGHHNQLIPVPPGVINNPNISYVDGILKCKFSSPVNSKTTALPALDQAWYLEYAVGDVKVKGKELVKQFHSRKAASNSKVKLTEVTVIENSTPALVKLHVFMMVIAWMLFNNLAINIARNYKDLKPDCTLLGAKIWFQLHRLLIALTALFTLIGIIAIFVHVNGFTIFLGLLRPDLKSRDRPFFNIVHRSVGMTCQILSIASICTGAYILNSYTDLIYGLMIFYVVYMVLLNIMLFIIDKYYLNSNRKCRDNCIDKLRIFKNLLLPIHSVIQLVLAVFVASYAVAGD